MKSIYLIFLLCVFSCQDKSSGNSRELETEKQAKELISKNDIQRINFRDFVADNQVEQAINGWGKYQELKRVIADVRVGNLSFFKSNTEIVAALNEELKTTIPEAINSPRILSRVIAVETKMYKLEGVVNLSNPTKTTVLDAVKELLVSYSNLNLQMNKQLERQSQNIQKPS